MQNSWEQEPLGVVRLSYTNSKGNTKYRNHKFFGDNAMSQGRGGSVNVIDYTTPYLQHLAEVLPNETSRALRHVAWRLQKEIKEGIAAGAPGGETWQPLSDVHKYGLLDDIRQVRASRKRVKPVRNKDAELLAGDGKQRFTAYKKPRNTRIKTGFYGRLGRAAGYLYEPGTMSAHVGWLGKSASMWAWRHAKGQDLAVTPKMRRMYAGAGIILNKNTQFIHRPPRPAVRPVFEARERDIPRWIEERVFALVSGVMFNYWGRT
ncbi:hypothetical protein [Desulfovibrio inopinatus]|uniref:hypothetical protein n=1 Tax=Desulfovibrio inopinatus TaxID=102109 RepID=UPI000402E17B|nr:hypothetical protein [Desulfovibrio inopinatus]